MAATVKAMRYARAAFEIAREQGRLDKWQADLEEVAAIVAEPLVLAFLESPKVGFKEKADLLKAQLKSVEPLVLNLLYLLIEKGHIRIISEVAAGYRRLLESHRGIEQAEVITAVPLSGAELEGLKKRLGRVVGKEIVLKTRVDPALISGMVARVGDKVIDGSTRSRLAVLKRELRQGGA